MTISNAATPAPRHVFDDPVSAPADRILERHPQTERTCKLCGAVKITAHPPDGGGFRLWRRANGWLQTGEDPGCKRSGDG